MQTYKWKKGLMIGIIVLFLGASCSSATDWSSMTHNERNQKNTSLFTIGESSDYDMVIIAPQKFESALIPLVDHKNSHGIQTIIMTTEHIYEEYEGADKPEQIKYFIKDAVETWGITFVLLVGGLKTNMFANGRDNTNEGSKYWYIPVRYTNLYFDESPSDPGCISDLYYADIFDSSGNFSSWDSNRDGIYAAWDKPGVSNDIIDLYPDVCVGRLPCRNIFEVKTMVKKIITYETLDDTSWFRTVVAVAGFNILNPYPTDEQICDHIFGHLPDFDFVRVYASNSETGGLVPTKETIIKVMNDGCGFILFEGVGNPGEWATRLGTYPEDWTSKISVYDVPKLHNGAKLPVCVLGGASHINLFNVTVINTLLSTFYYPDYWVYSKPTPECFGWWVTRKPGGGSIATIGSTGSVYRNMWIYPLLEDEFFQAYGNGTHILGKTHTESIQNYLNKVDIQKIEYKTVQDWTLFGDPSLMIGGYQ